MASSPVRSRGSQSPSPPRSPTRLLGHSPSRSHDSQYPHYSYTTVSSTCGVPVVDLPLTPMIPPNSADATYSSLSSWAFLMDVNGWFLQCPGLLYTSGVAFSVIMYICSILRSDVFAPKVSTILPCAEEQLAIMQYACAIFAIWGPCHLAFLHAKRVSSSGYTHARWELSNISKNSLLLFSAACYCVLMWYRICWLLQVTFGPRAPWNTNSVDGMLALSKPSSLSTILSGGPDCSISNARGFHRGLAVLYYFSHLYFGYQALAISMFVQSLQRTERSIQLLRWVLLLWILDDSLYPVLNHKSFSTFIKTINVESAVPYLSVLYPVSIMFLFLCWQRFRNLQLDMGDQQRFQQSCKVLLLPYRFVEGRYILRGFFICCMLYGTELVQLNNLQDIAIPRLLVGVVSFFFTVYCIWCWNQSSTKMLAWNYQAKVMILFAGVRAIARLVQLYGIIMDPEHCSGLVSSCVISFEESDWEVKIFRLETTKQ